MILYALYVSWLGVVGCIALRCGTPFCARKMDVVDVVTFPSNFHETALCIVSSSEGSKPVPAVLAQLRRRYMYR